MSKPAVKLPSTPAPSGEAGFHPRTELGRRLWELRQAVLASGAERLDWNDLERELAERRGGDRDA